MRHMRLQLKGAKWAIFISGRGSNCWAAIDELGDQVRVVVTSNLQAGGVLRAKRAGIEVIGLNRPINWLQLTKELSERQINRIFLLGFMKIIPLEFIQSWREKIFNLHPSLLPLFPGLESIRKAFDEKASVGVSVHEVIPQVDAGKVLLQKKSFGSQELEHLSFTQVELKVHQDEQLLVRKIIGRS